jgi:hypothetical protein
MRIVSDEISALGEVGLEFQTNIAKPAIYGDNQGQGNVFQGIIEPAYGIAEHWEVSLQLPVEQVDGAWYGTGFNTELQYVAPHNAAEGFYWGGRAEINYVTPVGLQESWQTELRAVFGYRADGWHLILNPSITVPSTGADQQITFEPSAKVVYQIDMQTEVGLEYFVETGSIAHFLPYQQQYQLPMFVLDKKLRNADINIGIGKGLTNSTDRWVFKTIVSFLFDSL